jgi:LysM repeat protein
MAIVDNSGTGLAALGRNEDRFMAHVAPGEMVVPPVISDKTRSIIRKEMAAVGLDPNEYVVGQGMSINPITGQAEFGFLKKIAKSVKKVVKKVAPIAAVIPGPWQPFAAVYQKGNAALKLAKGEGGLGDIMTLAAGGRQSLFGKEGAIEAIKSGTGILDPTKLGDAFKNIGQVAKLDAAGNIVKDAAGNIVTEFSPLAYGSNVLQGIASDQQQGYGGLLGGTGQKFNVVTGQLEGTVGGAGYNPFMKEATTAAEVTVQSGDTLDDIAAANNTTADAIQKANPNIIKDKNKIFVGDTLKIPGAASSSSNFLSGLISGGGADNVGNYGVLGDIAGGITDKLGITNYGGATTTGTGTGFGGIDPKMAGLALLYGKVVKDAAKKTEGGLTDIRQSKRPDLNPAPVFAGFDLGIRKKASFGGPIGFGRQYFNEGGMAVKELDMRQGGESVGPGTGTSDDIPAMLSDGEFVMTAAANNGAGGFKFNKTKKGIELIAASKPNREKGVDVMTNLMETFEKYNKSGSMA